MLNKENIRSIVTQLNCRNMYESQKEKTKFPYLAKRLCVMFVAILHAICVKQKLLKIKLRNQDILLATLDLSVH